MGSREREHAVQRMKDYIEEHITEPITRRMLADAANYSPWHADRVFKELTGQTPFEYLRAVRLARAAARLRDTDAKIVDVAFDFVFGSHEGFTRAFSRHFGMTPQQYRKHAPLMEFLLPSSARGHHLTPHEGVSTMLWTWRPYTIFVQVVDRPARRLILKWGTNATHYYEYYDEVIRDTEEERRMNAVFADIKEAISEIIAVWVPANLRKPGASVFNLGVEVPADYAGDVPAGFDIIDLPPCKMVVFQGPPYEEGDYERGQATETIQHAMRIYDPTIYWFEWADEDGPRFGLTPMGYRGCISARPVRQLTVKSQEEMPGRSLQAAEQVSTRPWTWHPYTVFVQVVDRPARKLILKWGTNATHYYEYCDEVGDEVWEVLGSIEEALSEPIGMWMPDNLRPPGTSLYVGGVEVPADYPGEVPPGFEIIDLPPCKMMFFQGPPTDGEPLRGPIRHTMDICDPAIYGFEWAGEDGPRFQLPPTGYRGYIEARPVRQLNVKSQDEMPGALQAGSGRRQG